VHPVDALRVQRPLDGVGDRGDRGPHLEGRRPADSGEVGVDDVEAAGQQGEDGGEVASRAPHAVQQQQGLA
jgi:hypothetical protein